MRAHRVEWGRAFDLDQVELTDDTGLIHFTHNETSTGVMLDLEAPL